MNNFHIIFFGLLIGLAGAMANAPAHAADLIPPVTAASAPDDNGEDLTTTHPMLRLTPDKSELVKLDRPAISIIVGNPAHLSVLLDTPELLVLVPRVPGATYFTALDEDGNVIMQRHVIVGSPKKNYVRVRRSCANGGANCRATSVYFCPDMCHEIDVPQMGSAVEQVDVPQEMPAGSSANLTADDEADTEPATMTTGQ